MSFFQSAKPVPTCEKVVISQEEPLGDVTLELFTIKDQPWLCVSEGSTDPRGKIWVALGNILGHFGSIVEEILAGVQDVHYLRKEGLPVYMEQAYHPLSE